MYNHYLNIFAIILGVIGTIKAIFSILKMRLKDVIFSRTALGQDTSELSQLRQVYDARVGTVFVVLSSAVQMITEILTITSKQFSFILSISIIFSIMWWIIMCVIYKKSRNKLVEKLPKEIREEIKL